MTTQPLPEGLHKNFTRVGTKERWSEPDPQSHMPQHLRERKMCCCVALCLARATQKLGEEGKRGEATEVLPLQVPSAAASQFGKRDLPVAPGCVNTSPFSLSAGLPCCMYDPHHHTWQPCKLLNRSAHIQAFIPAWGLLCFQLQKGRRIISNRPTITHGSH